MGQYREKNFKMKNGTGYSLRSANKDDAKILMDFLQVIFSSSPYILTTLEDFKVTLEQEAEFLDSLDKAQSGLMLLAMHEGRVIGNLDIRASHHKRTKHRASLGMSVLPDFRGQGIARVLLEETIAWAKADTDIEKLELGVIGENTSAIKLYESCGFKEEGRSIKGFYADDGQYLDEILMGLWIKALRT